MASATEIVGQIYDAAFDAEIWPELLCAIADYAYAMFRLHLSRWGVKDDVRSL